MTEIQKEALRYLGYRGNDPDDATYSLLCKAEKELRENASMKFCFRALDKSEALPVLKGEDIIGHIKDCNRVILFAATLGVAADSLIRRAEISDMAYAVILDSMASALIEEYCDSCETEMKKSVEGHFTTRFSPGYGDYPISEQEAFIAFLNANKLIGLTATESHILIPRKSVTAVIGVSDKPIEKRKRSCESCNLRETCKMRKENKSCDN